MACSFSQIFSKLSAPEELHTFTVMFPQQENGFVLDVNFRITNEDQVPASFIATFPASYAHYCSMRGITVHANSLAEIYP